MARGSSYGNMPTDPPKVLSEPTKIPRRATRDISNMSTQVADEPETRIDRPLPKRRISVPPFTPVIYDSVVPHPLVRHRSWLKMLLFSFVGVLVGAMILVVVSVYTRTNSTNNSFMKYNA